MKRQDNDHTDNVIREGIAKLWQLRDQTRNTSLPFTYRLDIDPSKTGKEAAKVTVLGTGKEVR